MSKGEGVHLLAGDDEFPLNMAARELVDQLLPKSEQAFGLEIVDGRANNEDEAIASVKRCREALLTRGFLNTRGKLVWWRDVSFLGDGSKQQPEQVKVQLKAFAALLSESGPGDNVLIITTPRIDRRSSLFKLCSERFRVREFAIPEKAYLVEKQTRTTIQGGLKAHGLRVDREAEELFFERVGSDSRQIASEIEKLALYAKDRSVINVRDVETIVSTSASSVMWDLQDALGMRDLTKALGALQDLLAQKESPIGIVVSLSSRIRDLLIYREALDNGWLRMSEGYGGGKQAVWGGFPQEAHDVLTVILRRDPVSIHPFAAGKLASQARNYTAAQLRGNLRLVVASHEALVSTAVPHSAVLELMLIRVIGAGDGTRNNGASKG
jgi:DNA polymerase-3 subunit delta